VSRFLDDLARLDRNRPRGRTGVAELRPLAAPLPRLTDVRAPDGIEGARVERHGDGDVFVVRREVEALVGSASPERAIAEGLDHLGARDPTAIDRGLRTAHGFGLADVVVLDLETTGFWGCPVFLVGMLAAEGGRLVTTQYLARDYSEEAAIVAAAVSSLRTRRLLVTFNGKSYDVPCLRERAAHHRMRWSPRDLAHVDLLHPARRLYRHELSDCRLTTLEREIVGIHRTGDVASADIPAVYHAFAATGFWDSLRPVLHHSRIDLVTTACLLGELLAAQARDEFPRPRPKRKRKRDVLAE